MKVCFDCRNIITSKEGLRKYYIWHSNTDKILKVKYMYKMLSNIPYSRKYWRELNLAVGSQMAIAKALADFNLAVRYGSPYVYMRVRNFGGF